MKKLLIVLALAGLVCITLPACDGGSGGEAGEGKQAELGADGLPKDAAVASRFEDEVPPLRPMQTTCFICGKGPIKQEHHADVTVNGEKKRVYFCSQKCLQNFEDNREEWTKGIGER